MNKQVSLIGMPMDLGQARRGVDMGPSAIRYAHIVERLNELGYDIDDLAMCRSTAISQKETKG